jgi:hypothetical protein
MYPTSLGVLQRKNRSNVVIVVSNRPWCFAAKSDQILVDQVFDKFSTSLEVLLNYLVICMSFCIVCAKLFQLKGEFSFSCIFQVGFI